VFRSIQWRITIPFVLLILGSIGFLGLYLVNSVRDTQIDNLRTQLENEARLAAQASLPSLADPAEYDLLDAGLPSLPRMGLSSETLKKTPGLWKTTLTALR